jgi:hypothetical protein
MHLRRYPLWPLFHSGQYTNWMMPSTGVLDGTMAKVRVPLPVRERPPLRDRAAGPRNSGRER